VTRNNVPIEPVRN